MSKNHSVVFRIIFLVGMCFAFLGLLFDVYTLKGYHKTKGYYVVSWTYHFLRGWNTDLSPYLPDNAMYKPEPFNISFILHIVYLVTVVFSSGCVIAKDVNHTERVQKLTPYSFLLVFLQAFIGFYVLVFPMLYLVPGGLHFFPATVFDSSANIIFTYSFTIGYILEVLAFIFAFPYVAFYVQSVRTYESDAMGASERKVETLLQQSRKKIDFKGLIAEEQIISQYQQQGED